jgi:8-oxo-dGTP diphosphatase
MRSPSRPILAGGAVVTREDPRRGTEVVIIHRKRYNDWTLPKGKVEAGEPVPVCAVREVHEETGVTIRLSTPLDSITYEAGNAGLKKVDYWGGVVVEAPGPAPDKEVTWTPGCRTSHAQPTHVLHDHFCSSSPRTTAYTPLIILRHAKAMDARMSRRTQPAPSTPAAGPKHDCATCVVGCLRRNS